MAQMQACCFLLPRINFAEHTNIEKLYYIYFISVFFLIVMIRCLYWIQRRKYGYIPQLGFTKTAKKTIKLILTLLLFITLAAGSLVEQFTGNILVNVTVVLVIYFLADAVFIENGTILKLFNAEIKYDTIQEDINYIECLFRKNELNSIDLEIANCFMNENHDLIKSPEEAFDILQLILQKYSDEFDVNVIWLASIEKEELSNEESVEEELAGEETVEEKPEEELPEGLSDEERVEEEYSGQGSSRGESLKEEEHSGEKSLKEEKQSSQKSSYKKIEKKQEKQKEKNQQKDNMKVDYSLEEEIRKFYIDNHFYWDQKILSKMAEDCHNNIISKIQSGYYLVPVYGLHAQEVLIVKGQKVDSMDATNIKNVATLLF